MNPLGTLGSHSTHLILTMALRNWDCVISIFPLHFMLRKMQVSEVNSLYKSQMEEGPPGFFSDTLLGFC